jgi:hypothetical protein
MAEDKKPSFLDQFLKYGSQAAKVYQTVRLADQGVNSNPTVIYETNGSGDPLVQQGRPAAVTAQDPFAEAITNATNKAAMAYTAKQASDSIPYVVGMMALGITIYLLTRK